MLISLALSLDVNLLCSDWFNSLVKHKTSVSVHAYAHICFCLCVFVYLHVCIQYVCKYVTFVGFCVCESAHSSDTVTSPSVMVLIVQMVKLAAPTKQQTIY